MEIDFKVTGFIAEMKPPEAIPPAGSGFLVKIGFFLTDKLKVIGEDDEVTKSQLCYEQKIVTRYSTQICDPSYAEQLAYCTLHGDMDMDPKAAEKVKAEVGRTIMNNMEVARNVNPCLWTVFMVIRVYCTIEISEEECGESSGEHGYDRLLKRLGDDDCSICREEFESTDHIVITTCHHVFHHSCLFEWLPHREIHIENKVMGSIDGVRPWEVVPPPSMGRLIKIGFFLKDMLKVIGKDNEDAKSHCCYEQKIITTCSAQIDYKSYLKQLAYGTLHDDMDMDPKAAEQAKADVDRTIRRKLIKARSRNRSNI
ncbi:hypothetical protein EJ110_NYTH53372 [Nymphaea thermarum]|nr:hypothetical protein EJ110_NYTH53372 [Nymphaea thermarum]